MFHDGNSLEPITQLLADKQHPRNDLKKQLVDKLVSKNLAQHNLKSVETLCSKIKFELESNPLLVAFKKRNAAHYFSSRTFRARNHADYMSLDKVEDLFKGENDYLCHLVSTLNGKGGDYKHMARGIINRHGLKVKDFNEDLIDCQKYTDLAKDLLAMEYDAKRDF
jgi:hypothetical protein